MAMDGKKDPGKFTIRFNLADPKCGTVLRGRPSISATGGFTGGQRTGQAACGGNPFPAAKLTPGGTASRAHGICFDGQ